jgi:DNA replication protein DnaC
MELNQDEISGWSASQLLQVLFSEEVSRREEGALKRRIQDANLTYADACYSRIDWSKDRQLNQAKVNSLFSLDWVRRHQNCIITGST